MKEPRFSTNPWSDEPVWSHRHQKLSLSTCFCLDNSTHVQPFPGEGTFLTPLWQILPCRTSNSHGCNKQTWTAALLHSEGSRVLQVFLPVTIPSLNTFFCFFLKAELLQEVPDKTAVCTHLKARLLYFLFHFWLYKEQTFSSPSCIKCSEDIFKQTEDQRCHFHGGTHIVSSVYTPAAPPAAPQYTSRSPPPEPPPWLEVEVDPACSLSDLNKRMNKSRSWKDLHHFWICFALWYVSQAATGGFFCFFLLQRRRLLSLLLLELLCTLFSAEVLIRWTMTVTLVWFPHSYYFVFLPPLAPTSKGFCNTATC